MNQEPAIKSPEQARKKVERVDKDTKCLCKHKLSAHKVDEAFKKNVFMRPCKHDDCKCIGFDTDSPFPLVEETEEDKMADALSALSSAKKPVQKDKECKPEQKKASRKSKSSKASRK